MSVGNIRKLQENTAALYTERKTLRVSTIRGSGHVWPEKLKRPPLPSGCEISGEGGMSADGIPDVKYPEKVESRPYRIPTQVEWAMPHVAIRSNSILIPEEDMWRTPLSGLPQGEAHGTREHHTPDDSISYPDMLSGSLTKVSKPCYSPCSAALRWCVRTPCLDIFAMDSQELSSISDCFGDQKTKT